MEKIWLKSYPKGVPETINPDAYPSLNDVFTESCQKFSDKVAYENFGCGMNYTELEQRATDFAAYLQQDLGLKKGERLAIMMPNCLQYPVVMFGAFKAGLTIVNVNPLYTARELKYQLNDAGVEVLVIIENFAHVLQQVEHEVPVKQVITTQLGDLFPFPKGMIINLVVKKLKKMVPDWDLSVSHVTIKDALKQGQKQTLEAVALSNTDIAFLQYTGGTTGVAKGAVLTHRNIIANLEQAGAWLKPHLKEGEEILVTPLPLYHIFSLTANCLTFMKYGGKNILITNPRDIPHFINEIKHSKFTVMTGVNTLFNALMQSPKFRDIDFGELKVVLGGGMSVKKDVAEKWHKLTGKPIVEAYGLTETSPAVCINPLNLTDFNGSIGLPVSSTDVSIRDNEGNELGIGEAGELCVKGPQVTQGYWQKPEQTEQAFFPGEWFRTGDVCDIDENGFVRVLDRKKDMIIVSGFNVYPNEVEDVLATHPAIIDAAVIGVASDDTGEAVKAFIVTDSNNLNDADIIDYTRKFLTNYKVPKIIEYRDELPKTPVGKILRRALRED